MHLIAAVDEVASETQLSEGWTYAVLPPGVLAAIDAAVFGCAVTHFHGKKFKKHQAADYEALLSATAAELAKSPGTTLTFTLLERSWKNQFKSFAERLIAGSMSAAGVHDTGAVAIAKHLFPGLMTLQRLTSTGFSSGDSIEVEIDSDGVSKSLDTSSVCVNGKSVATARLLATAYEGHRKKQFSSSPVLGGSGIRALGDAQSRAIQVADVFGNFALSYVFVQLGHTSSTRSIKAAVLQSAFGAALTPGPIVQAATLAGADDIQLKQSGSLTLRMGA